MHVCVYCKYVHFISIQLPWFEIYSLKSFLTLFPVAFITAIQTNLFEGTKLSGLSPGPHVEAVENGSFKVVGQVMVMSILQGPVVQTPVSANPGLNFNQGFFFLSSKELSRMIFYIFLEYPIIKL